MAFNPSLDASSFNMYDSSFNDLDNLFEGFFDLSMPTIWQDPLFDGDAFQADLDLMSGVEGAMGGMEEGYDATMENGAMSGKMDGAQGSGYPEIGMH